MRLILTLFLLLFSSNQAQAACASPVGAASQTRYDFAGQKMYYCDNTNWVEMGGSAGSGVSPTNVFTGSVGISAVTAPGITFPAYYVISSIARGTESNGGSDRRCDFKIKINGSWVTLATKNGNGTVPFAANIIQVSAVESHVQASSWGNSNKKYNGTWNGQMYHGTYQNCAAQTAYVLKL